MAADNELEAVYAPLEGGDGSHGVAYLVALPDEDGFSHFVLKGTLSPGDDPFGFQEAHVNPSGASCGGYVAWRDHGYMKATGHRLVSLEPLHIEPSLGCRTCPSHGFIRHGRWQGA